jgi:hypothetical protein
VAIDASLLRNQVERRQRITQERSGPDPLSDSAPEEILGTEISLLAGFNETKEIEISGILFKIKPISKLIQNEIMLRAWNLYDSEAKRNGSHPGESVMRSSFSKVWSGSQEELSFIEALVWADVQIKYNYLLVFEACKKKTPEIIALINNRGEDEALNFIHEFMGIDILIREINRHNGLSEEAENNLRLFREDEIGESSVLGNEEQDV